MTVEAKRKEIHNNCREWMLRTLSAIKSYCILNSIGKDFLRDIGFGFFDDLIGKNVILITFRIPREGEMPFFRIFDHSEKTANAMMDMTLNLVRDPNGQTIICPMLDLPEHTHNSTVIGAGNEVID